MSGNAPQSKKKLDRRIRRTRDRLGDALVELVQEKPFDSITVQDVLERADVGRSTFYAHFSDKQDLFLSDADEFFEALSTVLERRGEPSQRVAPVRELFAHLIDARPFYDALVAAGRIHDLLELAQGHFALGIEQRLRRLPRAGAIGAEERAAQAQALAGALLSLLTWWIRAGMPGSPEHMDSLYHALVSGGVGCAPSVTSGDSSMSSSQSGAPRSARAAAREACGLFSEPR